MKRRLEQLEKKLSKRVDRPYSLKKVDTKYILQTDKEEIYFNNPVEAIDNLGDRTKLIAINDLAKLYKDYLKGDYPDISTGRATGKYAKYLRGIRDD